MCDAITFTWVEVSLQMGNYTSHVCGWNSFSMPQFWCCFNKRLLINDASHRYIANQHIRNILLFITQFFTTCLSWTMPWLQLVELVYTSSNILDSKQFDGPTISAGNEWRETRKSISGNQEADATWLIGFQRNDRTVSLSEKLHYGRI